MQNQELLRNRGEGKNFLEIEENKSLTPSLTHRPSSLVNTNILILELFSASKAK